MNMSDKSKATLREANSYNVAITRETSHSETASPKGRVLEVVIIVLCNSLNFVCKKLVNCFLFERR